MKVTHRKWLSPVDALSQVFDLPDFNQGHLNEDINQDAITLSKLTPYQLTNQLQNKQEASPVFKRQGFRIAEMNFMIRYDEGREVSEVPSIYPAPNSPSWFLGFTNLHGLIIPIFDLKNYLQSSENNTAMNVASDANNMTHNQPMQDIKNTLTNNTLTNHTTNLNVKSPLLAKSKRAMLFVIQQGENSTGIIIDGLLERLEYESSFRQHKSLESENISSAIQGCYLINNEAWFELDTLKLLNELETSLVD